MNQGIIWREHSEKISVQSILSMYKNPALFQVELADLIDGLLKQYGCKNSIEVGCESGITSMLLKNSPEKTYLDINEDILSKVQQALHLIGDFGEIVCEDMFKTSFSDGAFDMLFNAGVVEHFDSSERVKMLLEYKRILSDDGLMVIAIPNHFSFPYRSAYIFHNLILRRWFWPWPAEYKIYDLKEELAECGLELVCRKTLAQETVFKFWRPFGLMRNAFKLANRWFGFEGYLTTLVIQKQK